MPFTQELRTLEIDIWLDAEDASTRHAVATNDEQKLAEAIEWGLFNCTHLLALISPTVSAKSLECSGELPALNSSSWRDRSKSLCAVPRWTSNANDRW